MNRAAFLVICLLVLLPAVAMAQNNTIDLGSLINTTALTQSDSLTNRLAVFAHLNWSQAGAGLAYKHLMLIYNKTVLPAAVNYKSDVSTSVLSGLNEDDYEVYDTYNTVMAGYMLKLGKDFYPFIGTGTAIKTEMIKIDAPDDGEGVYTIKGKDVTYGTGIAGAVIKYKSRFILEGSVQFKPLLPFVGIGIIF